MDNTTGYIYCFSNPSYENGTYKIGCTHVEPILRAKQLHTTGVPQPFKVELSKKVKNYYNTEKKIHKLLSEHRVNENREFFKIPLDKIENIFELVEGENMTKKESKKKVKKTKFPNIRPTNKKTIKTKKTKKTNKGTVKTQKNIVEKLKIKNNELDTLFKKNKFVIYDSIIKFTDKDIIYLLKKYDTLDKTKKIEILTKKCKMKDLQTLSSIVCPSFKSNNKTGYIEELLSHENMSLILDLVNVNVIKLYNERLICRNKYTHDNEEDNYTDDDDDEKGIYDLDALFEKDKFVIYDNTKNFTDNDKIYLLNKYDGLEIEEKTDILYKKFKIVHLHILSHAICPVFKAKNKKEYIKELLRHENMSLILDIANVYILNLYKERLIEVDKYNM